MVRYEMSKNNIALSFEKSEYYTLQEASDYLNLKHGINNVTPKKLLKSIVGYDIVLFVYARGFEVTGDYETALLKDDITDEQRQYILRQIDKINDYLSVLTFDGCGLLLQIDSDTIKRIKYFGFVDFEHYGEVSFDGALSVEQAWGNPKTLDFLNKYIDKNVFYKILALYPHISYYEYDDILSVKEKSSLKFDNYQKYDIDLKKEHIVTRIDPYFIITIDDLIILHKDLETLENNIINNSPIPSKSPIEFKARKGVSQDKIIAMKLAKILAKNFWDNDRDQTIRIGEMASIVYRELHNNGFEQQLPQEQMSLKEWIKDIAPEYAQVGGRPTNQ